MGSVVNLPLVPDGEASMQVYLVKYDEDQWYKYDEAGHQFCYEHWIRKATPLGVRLVVLQLVPDAIFPRDPSKPLPYVAWEHEIKRSENVGFKCNAAVFVTLDEGITDINVAMRHRIESALREYPNGTKFQVVTADGKKSLMQGKVQK